MVLIIFEWRACLLLSSNRDFLRTALLFCIEYGDEETKDDEEKKVDDDADKEPQETEAQKNQRLMIEAQQKAQLESL